MRIIIFALCVILFVQEQAYAQNLRASNEPLEVTADESLEWNRNAKTFIARKNARAAQGDISIEAQKLTASYSDKPGGGMQISEMKAENGVVIKARDSEAYGNFARYNLNESLAVMTGNNLRLVSPDQSLSATEKLEYWVDEGRLVAYGNAKISRQSQDGTTDTLQADTITIVMTQNPQGQRVLNSMVASGNVIITTQTETLTGDYGEYQASTNMAEIKGNVEIRRGPNILQGARAEVNLANNVSKMYGGSAQQGGRIKGVFFPGSQN